MKSGLTLTEMASELTRRNDAKRDFIADTRQLEVVGRGGSDANPARMEVALALGDGRSIDLAEGDVFREQVGAHYKIPREYAERIRVAHPSIYRDTLNGFFREAPARRMIRVLDNKARAFLSDRYRPLDNFDLANAVLPTLMEHSEIRIDSTQFTERRFYLKAVLPKIQADVKVGDPVQIGLMISNSEVGNGALVVAPLLYRLICKNGMISPDYGQRKYHTGRRASEEESAYELYTDETKQLDDEVFFRKVRDTVKNVLTSEVLERLTSKLRDATEQPIESKDLPKVVEVTAAKLGYTAETQMGILTHLIQGGDLTRYGLMNAITRQSQDESDYETATRMEIDGSRIIELPKNDWAAISGGLLRAAA